jgi:outer membrane protein assembly factor BamB
MRTGMIAASLLVLSFWLFTCDPDAEAANWPRFRGPNGTGAATDKDIPTQWSEKDGILWKATLPGGGNSSPILWEDKIFLQTASPDFKECSLLCLSSTDGKELWSKSISGSKAKTHAKNSMASGTPATDGERVYVSFWDGKNIFLHAYHFKGSKVWDRDLGTFASEHGAGASPMVHGNMVYYNHDQDGKAVVIALESKTGNLVWEKSRKAFRACYSTPMILEDAKGPAELIVASTAAVTSYDPMTGAEQWNWNWDFAPGQPLRTVASPVVSSGLVFVGSGEGGGSRHFVALRLGGKGEIPRSDVAWDKRKGSPYVPTVVAFQDHLYFVNDSGVACCYNARTGAEVWSERLGGSFTASPVQVNGKIYAAGENGNVFVFLAAPTYKLLAKNAMTETIMATPAVAGNRLYIRTNAALYCIGKPQSSAAR